MIDLLNHIQHSDLQSCQLESDIHSLSPGLELDDEKRLGPSDWLVRNCWQNASSRVGGLHIRSESKFGQHGGITQPRVRLSLAILRIWKKIMCNIIKTCFLFYHYTRGKFLVIVVVIVSFLWKCKMFRRTTVNNLIPFCWSQMDFIEWKDIIDDLYNCNN